MRPASRRGPGSSSSSVAGTGRNRLLVLTMLLVAA